MWPQDPVKYDLLKSVIDHPENPWRPLTYWNTVTKNLNQTYKLLQTAKGANPQNDGYYHREYKNFIRYGLLNAAGRPSRTGQRFLRHVEERLAENPEFLNKKNVNPFELEYLLHKQLHEAGSREVFSNIQSLLRLVPDIHTDDLEAIVSVVAVNNGDTTLEHFNALTTDQKKLFFKEITGIQKEMHEAGGLNKTKLIARTEWSPYLDLISRGALQGDGYQRAASLLRAHILLLVLIRMRDHADEIFAFEELHDPFRSNIAEDAFRQLLRTEPEIEETSGFYRYIPNRKAAVEEVYEENVRSEIQKIKYEILALTEEEKFEKIKDQLRVAERSPIVTTSKAKARQRVVMVRHVRDPKTSALMRLYYKDVCQLCGFNGNSEYGIGIAEVDHAVYEIAKTQNNRPSNLLVLCPNCHSAKTKGVIVISNHDGHFIAKNTFSGIEKRVDKIQL